MVGNFALKRSRSMGFDDSHRPAEMIKEREEEEARVALERASLNNNTTSNTNNENNENASSVSSAEDDTDTHEISSMSSPELEATDPAKLALASLTKEPPTVPVHDDSDVHYEPSRHVDYLSHDWKESDISSSWRYIVLRRKEVANSARLENASWRTWAKAKYNLKTVSPESVNWLKDYDVTWLYGPLCRTSSQATISGGSGDASSQSTTTNSGNCDTKSILKKRSATEMILALPPMRRSKDDSAVTPAAIAAAGDDKDKVVKSYFRHHQYRQKNPYGMTDEEVDTLADKLNAQYKLPPKNKSSSNLDNSSDTSMVPSRDELIAPPPTANKESLSTVTPLPASPVMKPKRRIHFNTEVQQCISLDYVSSDEENQYDSDSNSDSDSDDPDDDEEPGLFLMVRSSSSASMNRPDFSLSRSDKPGFRGRREEDSDEENSEDDNKSDTSSKKVVRTIAPIPPTSLKYAFDDQDHLEGEDGELNVVSKGHSAVSHNNSPRRDYAHYDYNSVYQAPINCNRNNNSSATTTTTSENSIIPKAPYMESPTNSLTPSPVGSPEGSPKPKYMDILEQVRQAQAALAAQPIEVRTPETDKNIVGTVSEVATLEDEDSDADVSDGANLSDSAVALTGSGNSPKRTIATTATPTTSTSTENVSGLIDEKEDRPKPFRSASADSTSSNGEQRRLIDKAKSMASNLWGWGSGSSNGSH